MSAGRVGLAAIGFAALATVSVDRCRAGSPAAETSQPEMEFEVVGTPGEPRAGLVSVDSVGPGAVVLTGVLETPTPCYGLAATAGLQERTLKVTITATGQPGFCIQVLGAFAYRARIHGLSGGRYTLEVVATYPGTGWESRVERLEVEVP